MRKYELDQKIRVLLTDASLLLEPGNDSLSRVWIQKWQKLLPHLEKRRLRQEAAQKQREEEDEAERLESEEQEKRWIQILATTNPCGKPATFYAVDGGGGAICDDCLNKIHQSGCGIRGLAGHKEMPCEERIPRAESSS